MNEVFHYTTRTINHLPPSTHQISLEILFLACHGPPKIEKYMVEWALGFTTHTHQILMVQIYPSSRGPKIGKQFIWLFGTSVVTSSATLELK